MSTLRRRLMSGIRKKEKPQWALIHSTESSTATVTTKDTYFGDSLYWGNGLTYKIEFDFELISKENSDTRVYIRDGHTQTWSPISSTTIQAGYKKHCEGIIVSNRERRQNILVARYYTGGYVAKATNIKVYKYIGD